VTAGRVVVQLDGDVPLLSLLGEFDLSNAVDLRDALDSVTDGHGNTIIIDLTETTFLDSTALGALALASREDTIRVRGATGEPRRVLELSGVIFFMDDEQ
jgi:anti-sigma B factor antagonist